MNLNVTLQKIGSDEYQVFHTIVSSTIYRLPWIQFLWAEYIYVHLNNNTFIVKGLPGTHNKEPPMNSSKLQSQKHYAESFWRDSPAALSTRCFL